ncbi:MAG: hypothetical protein K2X74_22270 [Acetobacteraceae bacterium]|nr:hypothetical protein [Acetobacteraceae bacterium]
MRVRTAAALQGRHSPSIAVNPEEDAMDRTSPDILAVVAVIGALLFWML